MIIMIGHQFKQIIAIYESFIHHNHPSTIHPPPPVSHGPRHSLCPGPSASELPRHNWAKSMGFTGGEPPAGFGLYNTAKGGCITKWLIVANDEPWTKVMADKIWLYNLMAKNNNYEPWSIMITADNLW